MICQSVKNSRLLLCSIALGMALSSCTSSRVPRPSSDSTAPSILLNVTGAPHEDITLVAGGNPGATNIEGSWRAVNLIAIAEDPQGVKNVRIEGKVSVLCVKGTDSLGQYLIHSLLSNNPDTVEASVLTKRHTALFHKVEDFMYCNPGFTYKGHQGEYRAIGVNFEDIESETSVYTIKHTP